MLATGASVNIYMFHGGTNFGLTNGANDKGVYRPTVTSYDYDAPLDEAGRPTAKYHAFREVIARYAPVPPLPDVEAAPPTAEFTVTLGEPIRCWTGRTAGAPGARTTTCRRWTIWTPSSRSVPDATRARRPGAAPARRGPRPRAASSSTVIRSASSSREDHDRAITAPPRPRPARPGRRGPRPGQLRPPHRRAQGSDRPAAGRRQHARQLADAHDRPRRRTESVAVDPGRPRRRRPDRLPDARFTLDDPADLFLRTDAWGKGFAWINGFCLGRYWHRGPQHTLYVPAPVLRSGANELVVLELDTLADPTAHFTSTPDLGPLEL